jgi:hypothetical protein
MAIYAALGVPEVWRLDGSTLTFQVLDPGGNYTQATHSRSFPQVAPADLMRFLAQRTMHDDNTLVAQFRAWLRQQPSGGTSPP